MHKIINKKIKNKKNEDQSKKKTHEKLRLNNKIEKKNQNFIKDSRIKFRNKENKNQIRMQNKLKDSSKTLECEV